MSEEWISARDAWQKIFPGEKPQGGPNAIIRRAASGVVRTRASALVMFGTGEEDKKDFELPKEFWGGWSMIPNWEQGDFSSKFQLHGREEDWTAICVAFERSQIEAMESSSALAGDSQKSASTDVASPASLTKNLGGRPPYDWEAIMIEMARQLYVGDLHPKTQADIEKAIAAYIPDKVSKSESTIREHARRLWQAIRSEDGK